MFSLTINHKSNGRHAARLPLVTITRREPRAVRRARDAADLHNFNTSLDLQTELEQILEADGMHWFDAMHTAEELSETAVGYGLALATMCA